ncbi:MAG: shikimate kinase [Clostridia bacterium]|nr:shikimate kinase [Clostridia bacterium]
MAKFGLLGRKLGHSYSPWIHSRLANYEYGLYEVEPQDLEQFLNQTDLDGFNVTIPYKKEIIPFLCGMTETAARLGSVNTVIRTPQGFYGHNTDLDGFLFQIEQSGFDPCEKKALVLGSGGVSPTVCAALEQKGAQVRVLSHKENTPENLPRFADTQLLVNTSPVGMFPKNGEVPVDLNAFPHLECVLDLIFNPFQTALMARARERGLIAKGGISMLVRQGVRACEFFTGQQIDAQLEKQVLEELVQSRRNIVLVGMPGCGKTTLGTALAEFLGREFADTDELICQQAGCSIPQLFQSRGEASFRELEHEVICQTGKRAGLVIATGGGAVTVEKNYEPLAQNGVILFLQRPLEKLAKEGRPLSLAVPAEELYRRRLPLYQRFADVCVPCGDDIAANVRALTEVIHEISCDQRT